MYNTQDLKLCRGSVCLLEDPSGVWKPLTSFHKRKSRCKTCRTKESKDWREARPEEAKIREKEVKKRWYIENPEYTRRRGLVRWHNITLEHVESMLEEQNYRCLICSVHNDEKLLVVDHNHETGKIRGLLCKRCNFTLGNLGDTLEGVQSWSKQATIYLEKQNR